jgi:Domain of unknown function (DUF6457)
MDEWRWLDQLAEALGEPPVDRAQIGAMLRLSRDVAHGVERKLAPLSTFVAGIHVGRRTAEGATQDEALREVLDAVAPMLPEPQPDASS